MSLRTQDLLFTLYGDYLVAHGGEASVGGSIGLMGCLDVSPQAVRSTLSRMSRKGWLQARQVGRNSYYSLKPKSIALLEEGRQRIFSPRKDLWDGRWLHDWHDDLPRFHCTRCRARRVRVWA